ncbi:GAF domain-containing hybrid sensor histidine kinase/response regulator [Sphingomonas lacusdianchii]|uniref:GAF domain-containing hybrid sensor histidine kinase/response regulator n=1 Tax=Sphingomonas lacusdianchii TaxID=2917992 RepID=UPI001F589429|nr:ATP-binding protein [Sphingomonas sp. JXJ CY 53]
MSDFPVSPAQPPHATPGFLAGGGECAMLIAGHDWTRTPLGPIDDWPQCLRTTLAMALRSPVPMVLLWGVEGVMLYNDAYSVFADARHPLLLGSNVREGWPEVAAFNDHVMQTVLAGGTLRYRDQELKLARSGRPEQVWMDLDYSPVLDEAGVPAGVICILADTTERFASVRHSQFLLSLSDALRPLATRAEITTVASERIAEWLGASRVFYAEISNEGMMVVERDHCRGVPSIAGVHSLAAFGPGLLTAYRSGQPLVCCDIPNNMDLNDETRSGLAERCVAAFVDVLLFDETDRVGVLAVQSATPRTWTQAEENLIREVGERVKNAVERARAEEGLRRLNETLEEQVAIRSAERDRLWNLSQDMLARADYAGMMSAVSPAWTKILGWSEAELLSRGYASLMHPDDEPQTLAAIAAMAQSRQPARFENRISTRDGDWKHIEWTVAPEADGMNFVAVGRDLSDAKARETDLEVARDALRQSQKMEAMGSLTGGVAHDFNNLLTPIIGSLDMLVRKGVGTEREQRLIGGALQSAERAKTLVQRLLAFARRQPLQPTAVDVARVIDSMTGLIGSTLGPTIAMRVDFADLPPARADLNQLEMALLNLAVNARDAMPDGGTLTITARRESVLSTHVAGIPPGDYVRLSVGDSGFGMDEETRRRAIEPFFSTKGVGKGTGLGLSMVHGLTAQLGGGLTIDSTPGHGTVVSLWFPVSSLTICEAEPMPDMLAMPGRIGTVLLIDDEELVRMSTAHMLTDLQYRVVEAVSAEDALRIMREGLTPDIVVTDHLMPGISGAQLARMLKASHPALPVLIVSGYAEEAGIDSDVPRLTKPFRNDELQASLAALSTNGTPMPDLIQVIEIG